MGSQLDTHGAIPEWGRVKRMLFRFVFVYLILYIFPFPLSYIPMSGTVLQPYVDAWNAAVPWVGEHVFGTAITVRPNGSGDTTYNYVQVFCYLVLALVLGCVWTLLDRRRAHYVLLYQWLTVYVRFYLGTTMIFYGAVKVIKSQFPDPALDRLVQPFGDASPMGLLWTFMGASQSYNVFSGAGEMLGGLLLTTRRTTLLGALVSIGVLANVVMLNFSYDVPVKLFSVHLLGMAVFLCLPSARRLANFLVLNRAAEAAVPPPLFPWHWLNAIAVVARTALVAAFVAVALCQADTTRRTFGDLSPRSPLYGIWNVEQFEIDDEARPAIVTDAARWRRVVFDNPNVIAIQLMSDSRQRYALKLDADAQTLALTKRDDPAWKTTLTYQRPEPGLLKLEGSFDGRSVRARLQKADERKFLLVNRGFHWINEYPFNR
jgi:hypothetical protein